jgi:hypothetical protein
LPIIYKNVKKASAIVLAPDHETTQEPLRFGLVLGFSMRKVEQPDALPALATPAASGGRCSAPAKAEPGPADARCEARKRQATKRSAARKTSRKK